MEQQLEVGKVIRFDYPSANFACVRRPKLERRRLLIDRLRKISDEPLDPVTVELEPARNRGTLLVSGMDLDKGERRSFWLESMSNVEPADWNDGPCEVVLLDDDGSDPEVVYQSPTVTAALEWAASWMDNPMGLTVGIRKRA